MGARRLLHCEVGLWAFTSAIKIYHNCVNACGDEMALINQPFALASML